MEDLDAATQHHDAFFKDIFSQPEHAREFFQEHLPSDIVAQIDWPTLATLPSSFVQHDLHQTHSDLLFKVQASGRELLLYLLFEHQTTVDTTMPLRILGYMQAIMQRHLAQHGLPLPPVLGYVLHQGPDRWTVSTHFADLFDLPPHLATSLGPYLPKFQHALLDLSQYDPDQAENQGNISLVLQLMQLARLKRALQFFALAAVRVIVAVTPPDFINRLLTYGYRIDARLDVEDLKHTLTANPELKTQAMSLQLLQHLMGKPVSTDAALASLSASELRDRFVALEKAYNAKHKKA
jgi:hypothetical protein